MIWAVLGTVATGLIAVFAALITGRLRYDPMSTPVHTAPDTGLPNDVPLSEPLAARLDEVRFDTALRGYRMDQVDAVLNQLQDRLAMLEALRSPGSGALPQPSADADDAVGAALVVAEDKDEDG
ncbi:MAG: DivIVA domain-containing protein [Nostocoides sp.]